MKRTVFGALAAALVAAASLAFSGVPAAPTPITVYKSPSCGCCAKWVEHLGQNGFEVTVRDTADVEPVKAALGVPSALRSCHTAQVAGYVVEGHVPADLIQGLVADRPAVLGLAVPGMPMGSPGMEGTRKDAYDVVSWTQDGKTAVHARR